MLDLSNQEFLSMEEIKQRASSIFSTTEIGRAHV